MFKTKDTEKVSVTDKSSEFNKKSVETKKVNGKLDARSKEFVQNNEKKRFKHGVSGDGSKKGVTQEHKLGNKEQDLKRESDKQLGNKSEKQEAKREENPQKKASEMGAELVKKFKREDEVGKAAGRSGGHGKPYKLAGAEIIRQANKLPKNDPMREALKKEGKRLVDQGKEKDHPYRGH